MTIPASVTEISSTAFNAAGKLTTINVADGSEKYSSQDGVLFNKGKTALLRYPMGKTDSCYAIPTGVESIGDYAFFWCYSLASVTIPGGVESIGVNAFCYCSSLASVTIPDGATSIGNDAFNGCRSLASVTIPASVNSIGSCAFAGCRSLADVYYDGTLEQWGKIRIGSNNDPLTRATRHTALSLSGSLNGTTLTYIVSGAPDGAILVAARYDGGRMTFVKTLGVSGNKTDTIEMGGSGTTYKLMLVGGNYTPLCSAWTSDAS